MGYMKYGNDFGIVGEGWAEAGRILRSVIKNMPALPGPGCQ